MLGRKKKSGDAKSARNSVDQAIAKARAGLADDLLSSQELAQGLEIRGKLHVQEGELNEAEKDFREALELIRGKEGEEANEGRLQVALGSIYEGRGRRGEAKSAYQDAIAAFEKASPVAVGEIASPSTNLALLLEAEDDFDQAETVLLSAVKACHEKFGVEHELTAALCNNIGTLYFKADHFDRAGEMHRMALEGRIAVHGSESSVAAQSHGNLALVDFMTGKIDEACVHFESALLAYEKSGSESTDDYQIVAANFRDVLESRGELEKVAALDARLASK